MTLEFLVTTFIITVSPGTGVVYTLANALSRGAKASTIAAFGCTLGIIPHLLAAIGGLAAILHTSAVIFEIFRYAGVAYLLYMAWNSLRENGALKVEGELPPRSALRIILDAVLLNLLNPKLSLFFLAFLPQFVRVGDPQPLISMLFLSGVFMVMTFAVFAVYGLLAVAMRARVISRPSVMRWLRRTFAGVFVLLGLRLVVAER
jgi:threonine/homoserine/homoserine lactone efflux protein